MANKEHLKILKQGADAWNKWRIENPDIQPDLIEADLRGETLSNFNLIRALLTSAKLTRVILNNANLQDSDLSRAELHWADLSRAKLQRAKLSNADLREIDLGGANLQHANLSGADLSKANLAKAELLKADLNGAKLIETSLERANLNGADLTYVYAQNAKLNYANLTNANLNRADFTQAQFRNAILRQASVGRTKFTRAHLFDAKLRGVDLSEADLSEANLTRAIIDEESLRDGQLSEKQWNQLGVSGKFSTAETDKQQKEQKTRLDKEPGIVKSEVTTKNEEEKQSDGPNGGEDGQGGKFKDIGQLSDAFVKFLVVKKGYKKSVWIWQERDGGLDDIGIDTGKIQYLTIDDHEKQKHLAIVEFGLKEDNSTIKMAQQHLDYLHGNAAYADIEGYVVFPDDAQLGEEFSIIRLDKGSQFGQEILFADFPTYEELRKVKKETEASGSEGGDDERVSEKEILEIIGRAATDGRTKLDLSDKEIKSLPAKIDRLTDLTELRLSNNQLTSVPDALGNLKNLTELYLFGNQLTSVPKALGNLTNLTELRLNGNQLKSVTRELDQLENLKVLDLSGNQLRSIPKELGNLTNLTELDLYNNQLTSLPETLGNLTNLKKLHLYHNQLTSLPETLGNLTNLTELNLYGNQLESPPPEVVEQGTQAVLAYLRGVAGVVGNVATMADDKASVKDLLGRMGLVESLANMFVHNKEMEGFTVALFGKWGEGKSTIMNLLTGKLKEKRPGLFDFATFNAWEYEHTKNIAAGLAQEVVRGLVEELSKWEKAKLTFNFARKEYGWSFLKCLFYLAVAAALPLVTWFISIIIGDVGDLKNFIQGFLGVGSVAVIGTLAYHLYSSIKKVVEHPMAIQLQTYLKLPNYGEHLGLIPVLKRHIEILCQLKLGKSRKLVVFVDDLDRCQPKCIAETLDAIRLVTAVQRVNVFICIDHRIAFKAIGEHYQKVGDGKIGRTAGEIARDYLGKIIQLPIRLQEPAIQQLERFVNVRLFPNVVKSPSQIKQKDKEAMQQQQQIVNVEDEVLKGTDKTATSTNVLRKKELATDKTETPSDEITEEEMQETEDERDEFYDMAKKFVFSNPRQLLRLRNCYRLVKALELQKVRKEKRELGFEKLKNCMRMLFWQEFLHNRSKDLRKACVKVLYENVDAEKISDEQTKVIIKQVKNSITESFSDKRIYDKTAEDVRIVVLPHSQED